jgi:hypothetical protein
MVQRDNYHSHDERRTRKIFQALAQADYNGVLRSQRRRSTHTTAAQLVECTQRVDKDGAVSSNNSIGNDLGSTRFRLEDKLQGSKVTTVTAQWRKSFRWDDTFNTHSERCTDWKERQASGTS